MQYIWKGTRYIPEDINVEGGGRICWGWRYCIATISTEFVSNSEFFTTEEMAKSWVETELPILMKKSKMEQKKRIKISQQKNKIITKKIVDNSSLL